MNLKLKNQNPKFAIDFFAQGPNYAIDDFICKKNSNKELRHLIDFCMRNITLRSLTGDETKKLQEYKMEQKGKRFRMKTIS